MATTYLIREGGGCGDKIQGSLRFGSFDIFKMDVFLKVSLYVCYPHVSTALQIVHLNSYGLPVTATMHGHSLSPVLLELRKVQLLFI